MNKSKSGKSFRASALAVAIQLAFGTVAWALPQGGVVVNGQAGMSTPGVGQLNVQASNGAIINWQKFSIGAGETTRFLQPSASSSVLNRVVGADMSSILGQLQGNGRVFLINPQGIVIGAGARIDTNSFIASTLDLSDADFLAGKLRFFAGSNAGSIRNAGVISAGPGGRVALIAPDIENSGIIQATGGQILLAAGRRLEISSLDFEGVTFEVQAPADSVLNLGKLLADNGAVQVFAGSLRHSGEIRANRMVQDADGSIRLSGSNEVTLTSDSSTRSDGLFGGSIVVQSREGTTRVAGQVSATGSDGKGGQIQLLGQRVAVDHATVDASGRTGGGQILIGGDYQGNNADVQNASRVYVGANANLKVDALQSGNGGRVIVWADENTIYAGQLSARGGAQGGDGGFAEVSGKNNLAFTGTADLGASAGLLGTLLLDPLDIVISSLGGILPSVLDQFADFSSNVVTISPAAMDAVRGNVMLQANRDIYFNDAVALTTSGAGLTATAGGATFDQGQIYLDHDVTTNAGAVTLRSRYLSGTGTITTGGGAVDLKTYDSNYYASLISSAGGAVTLASQTGGVYYSNVNAGSGAILVTGTGVSDGTFTTTGTASLNATDGSLYSTNVTADTVNLTATGTLYNNYANAASRINATSTNSYIQLYNLNSQPLRLGTLNALTGIYLYADSGLIQASGGLSTAPLVEIDSQNSTSSTGTALAPLLIASPRLIVSGMNAPAFVALQGGPTLTELNLSGTVTALGASSITGAANVTSLSLAAAGGVLSTSAISTGGFDSGFSLRVSDGAINAPTLTLPGGDRKSVV